MSIKVISLHNFPYPSGCDLDKEIIDFLELSKGDEILFILKNNNIYVRKFKDNVPLNQEEKYISSSAITAYRKYFKTLISKDVMKLLNIDPSEQFLWTIDSDNNVIIRNTILIDCCSKELLKKDIPALIIGTSKITIINDKLVVWIPKEIIDILGILVCEKIVLSMDKYYNIIISRELGHNLLIQDVKTNYIRHPRIYLSNEIIDILDIKFGDKILWIYDEDGNIILKNAYLPDNCE
jgi:hypothetical protein